VASRLERNTDGVVGFFAAPLFMHFILLLGFGIELPPYRRLSGSLYLAIGVVGCAVVLGLRDF
jgi:hypothetical protein